MTHESKAWQKSLVGMYGRIWVAFTDRGPTIISELFGDEEVVQRFRDEGAQVLGPYVLETQEDSE